jgi:hypothetical protein
MPSKNQNKPTTYDKLPKQYRKLIDSLAEAAQHNGFMGERGTGREVDRAAADLVTQKNRLALAFKRLLDLQEPAVARVICNLHGGIVQDVCYDGKHPIKVIVVDWNVEGGEEDHLFINDEWCWVYSTQVDAYDPQDLTDVAAAADAYLEKSKQETANEVLPDPR